MAKYLERKLHEALFRSRRFFIDGSSTALENVDWIWVEVGAPNWVGTCYANANACKKKM